MGTPSKTASPRDAKPAARFRKRKLFLLVHLTTGGSINPLRRRNKNDVARIGGVAVADALEVQLQRLVPIGGRQTRRDRIEHAEAVGKPADENAEARGVAQVLVLAALLHVRRRSVPDGDAGHRPRKALVRR